MLISATVKNSPSSRQAEVRSTFVFALVVCLSLFPIAAHAYRPFDGTDASVADENKFELELGPLGYLRQGSAKSLIVPAFVANYGVSGEREIVLEGKLSRRIGDTQGEDRTSLSDGALSLKQVLRRGALQDQSSISLASECGILLPTINGEPGTGAACALVGSQRWSALTLHLNGALDFNRDHHWNRFVSLIVEGPNEWRVRPVAEAFAENEVHGPRTRSRLVGLIWRARENLVFDVGVRGARSDESNVREIRAGLTWTLSFVR